MTTILRPTAPQPAVPSPAGPRLRRSDTGRRRLAGVAFLLIPALLIWLCVAVYNKEFTDVDLVVVETDVAGNDMRPHADVKLRGVIVGEVQDVTADADGATLTLAMKPGSMDDIPADVSAQLLPTTLFGERYVALIPAADAGPSTLAEGTVITQDRSSNAIEINDALDNLLPALNALQPQKMSSILTAMATALDGRGTDLGETIVTLDQQLAVINPQLPALNEDISRLVEVSNLYADTAPDIVDALNDFSVTSATIAEERGNLSSLYQAVTTTSQDLNTFLRSNQENIIRLAETSRPTLDLLREYSPSFPCTLQMLSDFVPVMDQALGAGTNEPGLHINVQTVPSRGAYGPGDTPSYGAGGGPQCYGTPYVSGATFQGTEGGLGLPNSEQESELVNELLAADGGTAAADLPEWSSLLAGPAFRGTEVELR
ncbi:MCE family protein [Streptomyces specialis]|uniref:MCE family protein n=1 Tax=Streptomyces specialis TaxID=498367 RepID=UPI00099E9B83|nr:MCE family protein [Streptomyces specialis]